MESSLNSTSACSQFASTLAGAIVIGSLLNLCLQGILFVQVYTYYLSFPQDRPAFKLFVYCTFAIEIAQSAVVARDAFVTVGSGFGNGEGLMEVHFLWLSTAIFGGIAGCVCQLFFAYRIWALTCSRIIASIVASLALAGVTGVMVAGVKVFEAATFKNLMAPGHHATNVFSFSAGVWAGCCTINDLVVAARMTYFLIRQETAFRSTRIITLRLIRLTIETGIATGATSAAITIAALLFHFQRLHHLGGIYFFVPVLCISKLYSNSLLVTLNSRVRIEGGRNDCDHDRDNNTPSQTGRRRQRKPSTCSVEATVGRVEPQTDDSTSGSHDHHARDKTESRV